MENKKKKKLKMDSKREIIELKTEEFFKIAYDQNKGYEMMEDKSGNWDIEKGSATHTFIVKRKSDGKFFIGKYIQRLVGTNWIENPILTEVFEEKVITIKYI